MILVSPVKVIAYCIFYSVKKTALSQKSRESNFHCILVARQRK